MSDAPAGLGETELPTVAGTAQAVMSPALEAATAEVEAVSAVARRAGQAIAAGHRIFAVGAGHAQAFAMELCHRAGGLPGVVFMNLEDLRPDKRDAAMQLGDSQPERDPANGARLLDYYEVGADDVVLIASNSGRNGAIVELALECQRRGIYSAAFTSRAHSTAVASRHESGLRLLEVTDDVVDNHCPLGDGTVDIPGLGAVCAGSTVSFALLAQMFNMGVIRYMAEHGEPVRVLISANVG